MLDHVHWECSRGISCRSLLMASLQVVHEKESSVSMEQHIADLQLHLSSTGPGFGLIHNNILGVEWDVLKRVVENISVDVDQDTVRRVHEHGGFLQRFRQTIQASHSISPMNKEAAIYAMEQVHQSMDYTKDEGLSMNHVREELGGAVYFMAILWCMDRLQVRSTSYSALPIYVDMLSDQRKSIYHHMTVIPLSSSCDGPQYLVADAAASLLKALTQTHGNQIPAMRLEYIAKALDQSEQIGTAMTTLAMGTVTAGTGACAEHSGTPQTPLPDRSPDLWNMEEMTVMEANIDDMTAEHIAFCMELLLNAGAADAWTTPVVMKKSRPGVTLFCLCRTGQRESLLTILFRQSTTLGVRMRSAERASLRRDMLRVKTKWTNTSNNGMVDVKIAYLGDEVVSIKAEFDHCRAISMQTGIPIQLVADHAKHKAQELIEADLEVLVEISSN